MVAGASDIVRIEGCILADRDKSIFFDDGCRKVWLPKSLVEYEAGYSSDTLTEVLVPEWLAIEKELV